ncbi:zinc finger protein 454-like [Artemia franciscana]|uniref:zinc finger protein 454-like n=1 Tax=Artemia franciscana TaxID=6661 RepID=UPI0032DA9B5A
MNYQKPKLELSSNSAMDGCCQETGKYSGEDYEVTSSEESDNKVLPGTKTSEGITCQDIRKNYIGDKGPIKSVVVNLESSAENKLLDKIQNIQSLENPYICRICNGSFSLRRLLLKHIKVHDRIQFQQCQFYCSKFKNKTHLDHHSDPQVEHVQRMHPSRNPFKCKLCGKTYDCIRKVDVHISSRACDKKDKSRKKSKSQSNSIEAVRNMNVDKSLKLFICNICDEEFLSAEDVQGHFNSAHEYSK